MKKIILIWGCLLLLVSSAYSQLSTYTFSQTAGTYIAVAGGTTLVNGLVDSGVSPVTSIGFTFNLDGTNYTQFSATSNGYMKLGGNPASSTGTTPLSTAAQMPSLAPFARDGKTNGVVVYSLTGSAPNRVLTVEWPNWFYYWGSMGTTNNLTMQVKLYETTNVIEFVYGPNNPITAYTGQCGIAVSITNYVNRTTNTNWTTSTAGTANINTIWISSSVKPSSGLTFRWSPPCNGGFQTWYADADGDGYGSSTVFQLICVQPSGYVSNALDCDDSNAAIYQGAAEVCNNGIDEDCSGSDSICVVLGCTDATASNFNPQANQDDGSCISTLTCNITAPTTTLCAGQSATLTMNTTGGAGASSQLPANLQQGLVAYYPFNGNANDESGNGNNGTVNGATLTSDRFGNVGSAYSFDGVGNFIEVASNSLLNCNSSLTINLYVRNISGNNSEMIIARERYASGTSYCLGIENSDYVLSLNNSPLNSVCPQCNKVLTSNGGLDYENWHQITGLWTGSIMSIYIDGVFVSSSNAVLPNNGQLLNSSSSLFIGKWMNLFDPTWGFRFFKGSVDDISIYNRALTPSEIQQLYTAQSYAWSTNATTPAITVSPTTNATYSCTVTQGNQTCTASVDITVNPAITNAVSATIVEGQSYTLGAQTLTTAGTYTEVFTSAAGCDSTVTLTLSVEPLLSCNLNSPSMGLCSGDQVDLSINFQITQSSSLLDSLTYAGEFGGHYYYFTQFSSNDLGQVGTQLTPLNLHDRLDIYGLDLVAIQNAEENDFVASLIPNSQFAIWIGLNDYVTNGVYLWSDGSVPSYFNWRSGEPNNNSGDEDYAIMYGPVSYPGAYSTWNDEPCGEGVGPCNPFLFLIESTYPINQNVLSYSWSTNETTPTITVSPTTNTTYSCTVTRGNSTCTASVDITVNPSITHAVSATIVEGQSYTLGTQTLTTAGTYTEVFTSAAGCDSTVTVTLSVESLLSCEINTSNSTICNGGSAILEVALLGSSNSLINNFAITNGEVSLPNPILNDDSEFTINAFLKVPNFTATTSNVFKQIVGGEVVLRVEPSQVVFQVKASYGNCYTASGWVYIYAPIQDSNYHKYSAIYNRNVGYIQLYKDDILISSQTVNNGSLANCNAYSTAVGVVNSLIFIDEISIFSYALNNLEVESIHLNELIGTEGGLRALWKFNEGTGTQILDSGPFSFNGSFNGEFVVQGQSILVDSNSYVWSTNASTPTITVSPTSNTTYSCTVTQGNQTCTASVDITVNPAITHAVSATIVEGQSYTLGTQTLTTAGTYTEVFTSAAGCDSTVTLTLSVEPLLTCNITTPTTTLCAGQSATLTMNTTGGAGASSQLPANLQQGLVAYYPFNGNANDESGNGNNGTVNGATLTSDRFGNAGSAYSFDGINDLIQVSDSQNQHIYSSNQNSTISFWILRNSNNAMDIISKGWHRDQFDCPNYVGNSYLSVRYYNENQSEGYNYMLYNSSISQQARSNSDNFSEWNHIVIVRDDVAKIYVNCELSFIQTLNEGWTVDYNNSVTAPLTFGGRNNFNNSCSPYWNSFFTGKLDDISFYNRKLSNPEIQQLYTAQSYAWSTNETTPTITVSPTTNTTYSCTVTSGTQTCTASIDITVNPQQTYFADADGDGYGNPDVVVQDCNAPVGYVSDNTDCNDNNALVFFESTEICNGLDDDCDGLVDEGLTVTSIQPVSVSTALYPTCSGNALKSANLNNGTNSDLIEGSGLDLWYSLTAQYNTLRASLSAAFGDNEIRLYSYNNGCFELLETEHEVYATTSLATGNQILISDDLIPGQTYYIAVHNISGAMNTSAKMCFNHFVGSTCDHYYSNNTGVYNNVCTSFKAQYKGNATNYIFDVLSATQNNANLNITPWSYTTTTASSIVPRIGTIFPVNMSASAKVYTLQIPVIYTIPDAAGNYTSITANATSTCTVTLNPELPIALRSTDRCPNTKNTSSSISVDRAICGALRYEWEFTQQLPSVQPAVTVLGGLNTTAFFLNNVPGMGTGKTYNVRVRPIHTNGEVGSWGSVQCLKTGTAGMVTQSENAEAWANSGTAQWANHDSPKQEVRFTLYPNPTSTGRFILTANHTSDEEVKSIKMMDITGKVVFQTQVVMNDNSVEVDFGNLASGVYVVMVGEERMRLVIQ